MWEPGAGKQKPGAGLGQRFAGPLAELLQCTVVRPPAVCMIECTPPPYLGQAAQSGVRTQCHQRLCLHRSCNADNCLVKRSFEVNILIVLLSWAKLVLSAESPLIADSSTVWYGLDTPYCDVLCHELRRGSSALLLTSTSHLEQQTSSFRQQLNCG